MQLQTMKLQMLRKYVSTTSIQIWTYCGVCRARTAMGMGRYYHVLSHRYMKVQFHLKYVHTGHSSGLSNVR